MSADNGIYVLCTSRTARETSPGTWINRDPNVVYRVAYTQAADNFNWFETNRPYNLGAYMVDVWGKSPVFADPVEANDYAETLARQYSYLEYGIVQIDARQYVFYGDL